MSRPSFTVFLAFMLISTSTAYGGPGQAMNTSPGPRYLMFQIFTAGPGLTTEPGKHIISKLPEPTFLDRESKRILDTVGERGDNFHRLGVIVGPVAMDYTDAQLRTLIEWTFAIASKYKIAVGFHIDDSRFWMNRRDLWSNPANVEWLDWQGTPNTGLYLNWGEPWKLAPQVCFNSPAMLTEARRLAGRVIGPAIAEQVAKLRNTGDDALFGGVIVGWETEIGHDFETRRALGYCALTNLGFSEKAPPRDMDRELQSVVQNWIETWSKSLASAGIPTDKIYSHLTFALGKELEEQRGAGGASHSSTAHTPLDAAFGAAHRPGFSTYPNTEMLGEIYAALNARGNPEWASSEGTNVDIYSGPPRIPDESMEDYLARMFNHGATLTNVFGWGVGDEDNVFRRATESEQALAAYRKFLRGVRLNEKPLAQSYRSGPSVLQTRMRALPGRIESYQRAGGDLSLIEPHVKQLEQDMTDGRFDAMTRELDLIEATINSSAGSQSQLDASPGVDVALLQQKMRALPQKLQTYQQRGGDMNQVKGQVESIQGHIRAGELARALEELQALDPILESR